MLLACLSACCLRVISVLAKQKAGMNKRFLLAPKSAPQEKEVKRKKNKACQFLVCLNCCLFIGGECVAKRASILDMKGRRGVGVER